MPPTILNNDISPYSLSDLAVWYYLPVDTELIETGIKTLQRLALESMPTLSESDRLSVLAVRSFCDVILNGLGPDASKEILKIISEFEPKQFFQWFDSQMPFRARDEMRTVIKAWVEYQAGKHDFSDLSKEDAFKEKHLVARGVQRRLDEVGLKILCKHVGRRTEAECGKVGRLNADLTGNSKSGQYLISHNGKAAHVRSRTFPALTLISAEGPQT